MTVRSNLPFSIGTFDSFMAGLGWAGMHFALCRVQTAYKTVQ